jgi:hypothetical protein
VALVDASKVTNPNETQRLRQWKLDRALTECVTRGWQSFKADWVREEQKAGRIEFTTDPDLPCDEWGFPLSVGGRG